MNHLFRVQLEFSHILMNVTELFEFIFCAYAKTTAEILLWFSVGFLLCKFPDQGFFQSGKQALIYRFCNHCGRTVYQKIYFSGGNRQWNLWLRRLFFPQ